MEDARPQLSDSGFEALWANVLENWDKPEAHAAFLQQAADSSRLPDAAQRYRSLSDNHERKEVVERQLTAITAVAFARIDASRGPAPQPKRLTLIAAIIVTTGLLIASISTLL